MLQILSLSYFDLAPHLRSCLLYLSIFPEDYEIKKDRLILRWIAEGFIHEECGFTQYELGERCFNELINRSLIQLVDSDIVGVILCRVHDTILEFIVSKAVEENFVTLKGVSNITIDPQRKIRRLSVQDRNEVTDASVGLQEKIVYSHARAVSVFLGSPVGIPSLLKFRLVRILDLQGCYGLYSYQLSHLCGLFALRYLSLRDTGIHYLPEEIGELQYLQTLDVRDNFINNLPSSFYRLSRLVNLFCDDLVRLPDGFGFSNMQALQWLEVDLSIQSPSIAQELRQLRNLRMLEVTMHNFTKDLTSSLCTLGTGSLNSLIIYTNVKCMDFVMEPWSPTPVSLKVLVIRMIVLPRVPRWIGSLDNLQDLTLIVKQLGPVDVGLLGRLNALCSLCLFGTIEVADRLSSQETQRVKISGAHGFPNLSKFIVGSDGCEFGLFFEAGAMPKLQELNLRFDRDKTGFLTNGEFDFGIQHLCCLAIIRCDLGYYINSDYEPEHPAWDALKVAVSSNPNHPKLYHVRRSWRLV